MFSYNNSIQKTLNQLMHENQNILLMGLGVSDPKRFFGTTKELIENFGKDRVLECPTSENAYLGHGLGLALGGFSPVVHFQRMDFMLYAFDQLVNNIAKWDDMFNRKQNTNLVIRTLIGMGWGQGAQHAQNLAPILAQFPGLKVVAPTCPESAAQLLRLSLNEGSPVIFCEHRWLQYLNQDLSENVFLNQSSDWKIGKAKIRSEGFDLTIVSWSYGVVEALRFKSLFPDLSIEVIDLLSLSPLDMDTIITSYQKTKNLIMWEPSWSFGGIGAEILAELYQREMTGKILRLGYAHKNLSSSPRYHGEYYLSLENIVELVNKTFSYELVLPATMPYKWPVDQDNNQWNPWKI